MPSTMLHVRIDVETKDQATEALAAMGLTVSDAVRVFLRRVAVERALPFDVKAPDMRRPAGSPGEAADITGNVASDWSRFRE
ncbi:type II toxin-antitoxin system RelB/DinJ family antitoxin [Niveispirillum sp. KHB5.9]|uniref:type II toxin-antitoxin system RelB/DinJ family antitoxin n=1 Tax=Niveispirillum sp. KHB5.9 TaxID=3400269 RepID=UPI003A839A93